MRSNHSPPEARASSQLPTAASSEPMCRGPEGVGAKRPTTRALPGAAPDMTASAVAVVAVAVLLLAPLTPLLCLEA